MRTTQRILVALSMFALLLGGLSGTATAATAEARTPVSVTAAWDCPSATLCVWDQYGGVGRRCTWNSADNDWRNGSVRCSWSTNNNVGSVYNKTGYFAWFYFDANNQNSAGCIPPNTMWDIIGLNLRSHEFRTYTCY
ncbi:peptidase inhibitor family I36 protein [Longispora sp. NPDC051575]|uniref:peptidase inhibitor family I36 protein n=1 Tax=Longispora sp. NPDC051575 TaxID=3154943 RepID=UPI003439F671